MRKRIKILPAEPDKSVDNISRDRSIARSGQLIGMIAELIDADQSIPVEFRNQTTTALRKIQGKVHRYHYSLLDS